MFFFFFLFEILLISRSCVHTCSLSWNFLFKELHPRTCCHSCEDWGPTAQCPFYMPFHFFHWCELSPSYYKICQEPWASKSEMPWEKCRHSLQNVPLLTFPNKQLLILIFKLQSKFISLNTMIFSLVLCRKNLCPQYTIWHLFKVFWTFYWHITYIEESAWIISV